MGLSSTEPRLQVGELLYPLDRSVEVILFQLRIAFGPGNNPVPIGVVLVIVHQVAIVRYVRPACYFAQLLDDLGAVEGEDRDTGGEYVLSL